MWDILPRQGPDDVARPEGARGRAPGAVGAADLVAIERHGTRRDGSDGRQEPEVDVRRAGVARVAAGAEDLAATHALAQGHAHRPRAQVAQLGVLARRVL